jgi:c-di-GMP-binding flagellar brake protein YcgR
VAQNEQDDFAKVAFQQERSVVMSDVERGQPEALVLQEESTENLVLKFAGTEGKYFRMKPVLMPSLLQVGDNIKIVFSLESGQYMVAAIVQFCDASRTLLSLNENEFYRLQRRSNFRVKLPPKSGVTFLVSKTNGSPLMPAETHAVADLSAGGLRLSLPTAQLEKWKQIKELEGQLTNADGTKFVMTAKVVSLIPMADSFVIGMNFSGVSSRDQQSLLFMCLQLRRTFSSVASKA